MTKRILSTSYTLCALLLCSVSFASAADFSLESLLNQKPSQQSITQYWENHGVTSVSKKGEEPFSTASAIHVITNQDIKRSGMTSIPELLRMVPGMHVARLDAHKWAITSRGFNGQFSNKLLVLIDGRSVYTPLFSGVFWDMQDYVLDDIERIEVIRGPGATTWGANAVNGVINVITKKASQTQGYYISETVGNQDTNITEIRYGGKMSDKGHYRLYGKFSDRSGSEVINPNEMLVSNTDNEWDNYQTGFRIDYNKDALNYMSIQGNAMKGTRESFASLFPQAGHSEVVDGIFLFPGFTFFPTMVTTIALPDSVFIKDDLDVTNANFLFRWSRHLPKQASFDWNSYVDYTALDSLSTNYKSLTLNNDIQYQKTFHRHAVTIGGEYRFIADDTEETVIRQGTLQAVTPSTITSFTPKSQHYDIISFFLQDDIAFLDDKLHVTLGSKFEHNDFTGFEYQPRAQIAWYPQDNQTLWMSFSRAVRTPARVEDSATKSINASFFTDGNITPFGFATQTGDNDFESENLLALEFGYRAKPQKGLSFDVTAFHNWYRNLKEFDSTLIDTTQSCSYLFPSGALDTSLNPPAFCPDTNVDLIDFSQVPRTAQELSVNNNASARSYGMEVAANWLATPRINFKASYSFFFLSLDQSSSDATSATIDSSASTHPKHQVNLHSYFDLPGNIKWDNHLYYTDKVEITGTTGSEFVDANGGFFQGVTESRTLPAHFRLDSRLSWKPLHGMELSLVGQNLLDSKHQEFFINLPTMPSEIGRSFHVTVKLKF